MDTRRERGGSRAQLIIITALVLATVFVALALVLNSGIYAENLSTRETTDSEAAIGYALEAEAAVGDAYRRANGEGASTAGAAREAFLDVVDPWAEARSKEAAKNGVSAEFDGNPHVGWHLRQDEDRSFTPAGDSNNGSWRVAHGAESVGAFEMDVSREELHDAGDDLSRTADEAFHVRVVGSDGASWRLYVFRNASDGEMIVHQGDPGDSADLDELRGNATHTCSRSTASAVIDFRAETFAGADCEALDFSDDVTGAVDVRYENPHNASGDEQINGTYTLVLNGTTAAGPRTDGEPDDFNATGGAAPTARAVVYSASYAAEYERADVRFGRGGLYAVREETYAG